MLNNSAYGSPPRPAWLFNCGVAPRASPRSRQQRRSGSAGLEKENATRGGLARNEAAPHLRATVGAARARKGRGRPPPSHAVAQTDGARRLLSAAKHVVNRTDRCENRAWRAKA